MENYQNLVGKLLAGENINIVQKRMDTAAFDIKTRTLYLPIWKDMTPEINDMLICHEVSHALFTPIDYVEALDKRLKFRNAKSYLNILEDVRVERLIKKKYPGIKKSFSVGYTQLHEKDFFGVKDKDLNQSHLMDRINLYFKIGYACPITFTEEEKIFVEKAGKTETIHDVIKLAEEIFAFIKESKNKDDEPKAVPNSSKEDEKEEEELTDASGSDASEESDENPSDEEKESDGSGSKEDEKEEEENSEADSSDASGEESGEESSDSGDEGDDSDNEGDESSEDNSKKSETSDGAGKEGESLGFEDENGDEIITDSAFDLNSKKLINSSEDYVYYDVADFKTNRIIPFTDVLNKHNGEFNEYGMNYINKFFDDNKDAVNYLVKEFEMKKAATSYKKAAISKSGLIDTKKIYAYQIKDDLFRRISITKDGKNHGMIMLVDWSGSMEKVIRKVIEQIVVLSMFCKRVNIPFQVLAFADGSCPKEWRDKIDNLNTYDKQGDVVEDTGRYYLVELFSHKMSKSQFNKAISMALTGALENIFGLNGTPLTESLLYMYSHIKKFNKENNVEKLTFITLTDGQGSNFRACYEYSPLRDEYGRRIKKRFFVRFPTIKKVIEINNDAATQMAAAMTAIKERYDCNNIWYFVTPNKTPDIIRFLRLTYTDTIDFVAKSSEIQKDIKKNDVACLTDIPGMDVCFILADSKISIENNSFDIAPNANAKKIAASFSKYMTKKKTSRILLNKFIQIIA